MTNQTIEVPTPVRLESKVRTQRTRAQWRSLVEDFTASGLTKTAFCKKQGIATSCLYRWQKVFAGQSGSADFIDINEPVSIAPPTPPPVDDKPHWQLELELGVSIVLRVRAR